MIYDLKGETYEIDYQQFYALSPEVRQLIEQCVDYLKEEYFIKPYAVCADIPISYKITSSGIRQIEKIHSESDKSTSSITIHGNVNGIVGHTVTGNTINQGYTLEEFKSLLNSSISNKQDLETINSLLEPLFKRMEINAPLDKGVLGNISEHLQKHDGIYSALLSLIGTYLSK